MPKHGAGRHQVRHQEPPIKWHDGFPLGNGLVGAMLWGDGDPLCLTLDRADLWDLRSDNTYQELPTYSYSNLRRLVAEKRFSEAYEVFEARQLRDNPVAPTKLSIGRAEVQMGPLQSYDCALDLETASIQGVIATPVAHHRLLAFVCRDRNVVCVHVSQPPPEARMDLKPLTETSPALSALGHPPPEREEGDGLVVFCQTVSAELSYAVAWNAIGPDYFLAVETGDTPEQARMRARMAWQAAKEKGMNGLFEEHCLAWREFWQSSAVHLPEELMEFLWYFGLYLLGSAARRGGLPPGLQGLWAMDGVLPPWRGEYAADMNVQETFWPALASGHFDLFDCWCDFLLRCLPRAQEFTRRFFGTEGSFWPCSFAPDLVLLPGWYTVVFAWSHSGWLAWMVWLRWRYTMDREWLATTGYPLVASVFRFYHANLEWGDDGRLHVPLSSSPEYHDNRPTAWSADPNIDLALINRCCDWTVEMELALGISELTAAAAEVRRHLAPYALTESGALALWPGQALDEPHRHPSHLMAIHPATDLTIEGDEEARRVIDASLAQYFSLGQYDWAGHTYAQMASFAAVTGRAEFAYDCLLHFAEYWLGPNGLHFNRDLRSTGVTRFCGDDRLFTMEANCGIAAGISDMLLQGWNDIVRVFPAVPAHWRDIAFRELRTEGTFTVSAIRRAGRTVWVRVGAEVPRQLRLLDPFGGAEVEFRGLPAQRQGDLLVADLGPGQELVVCLPGETGDMGAAALAVSESDTSRIGLR